MGKGSTRGVWVWLSVWAMATVLGVPAFGDQPQQGWYVVREGDTLRGISERYLGQESAYPRLLELNPEISDENLIRPGQRIQLLFSALPEDSARLSQRSNRVENQMLPLDWETARINDVLRSRDSVRTFERSSAELEFSDSTHLIVSEESMIFLDRMGDGSASRPSGQAAAGSADHSEADQIEIVVGQADLASTGGTASTDDGSIELIMGEATASPRPNDDGELQTRARVAEGGKAQLMVYGGESSLSAGGADIEVPTGMGSTASSDGPPTPPEKLLDAARGLKPASGARLATPRPTFDWQPVDGAVSYTLEVCFDADCAQLVQRVTGVAGGGWQPADNLPVSELFWRVTAVSASGLDGYPAEAQLMTVLSDREDEVSPTVAFRAAGAHLPPRWGLNQRWILGPGASIEPLVDDATSGVDRIELLLDEEVVEDSAWRSGWPAGEHVASLMAVDGAGNEALLEPVPIVVDLEPPVLTWGVEGGSAGGTLATPASPRASFPSPLPKQTLAGGRGAFGRAVDWQIERDPRQLLIRPSKKLRATIDGQSVEIGPENGLWVLAADAVIPDLNRFDYAIDVEGRSLRLEVVAVDGVGNTRAGELVLAK